jgi:glycerol-3-phosphate acyltransferase PlsY
MLPEGFVLAAALGYLLGSIPFGLLLTRAAGLGDIRAIGSGNIGATNVLRTGKRGLALATLLLDGGKGAAAVLLAAMVSPLAALGAGIGALFGHLFPVWLSFKGGKGVATGIGVLLALDWRLGLFACAIWLALAVLFRISSLAALGAFAAAPIAAWVLLGLEAAAFVAFASLCIFLKHRANIARLLRGEEPKIGRSKPAASG